VRRLRWPLRLAAAALLATGCSLATDPVGEVADLRGTWRYSGDQTAPALTLEGTLTITAQSADVISGQLSWQEQAAGGGTRTDGGPVSGRVIETTDVDFDVILGAVERRHVGRITGDTVRGAWIELTSGKSGNFLAIRGLP
jgi:hypothetical protein